MMFYMVPRAQDLDVALRASLVQLSKLATGGGVKEAAIAVHTKMNVRGSAIESTLGDRATGELLNGRTLWHGLEIHLITERISSAMVHGPLIAAYVSPRYLAKLEEDPRITDVIFLPWNQKEEQAFLSTHNPVVFSAPTHWSPQKVMAPATRAPAASIQHFDSKHDPVKELPYDSGAKKPHVVLLGAGASLAAFPKGDANGRRLPIMNNLAEVVGISNLVPDAATENFESFYSRIAIDPAQADVAASINAAVYEYFDRLELPATATIYDYLVLSLREKDLIATFNWDPFLLQAFLRNASVLQGKGPQLAFLHGNVLQGVCEAHRILGIKGRRCSKCRNFLEPTPLLFPVSEKNYESTAHLADTWSVVQDAFANAFMVTIFGYGAPKTDVAAVQLLKDAWGTSKQRPFEQFEVIDVRPKTKINESWREFVHTHHYETHKSYFKSSLALHPRRTQEDFVTRYLNADWTEPCPAPRTETLSKLQQWHANLIAAEVES